jgi:DNA-3-methyladenine glycosylase
VPSPIDFSLHPVSLAERLIGVVLTVDGVGGAIVETEAYDRTDPASHSFSGPTARNAPMFGPPGRAYVYRSYGMHWCFNIVCGGDAGAVLVRALQPTHGADIMRLRRGTENDRLLCAGPGRLCQALGIDAKLNNRDLAQPPFAIKPREQAPPIVIGPRIGITKAADRPWRFGLRGSRYLSKPFPKATV